jgi:hypothetical protein
MAQALPEKVVTGVVCYTQATFDFEDDSAVVDEADPLFQAHQRALLAQKLAETLTLAKIEADVVKVPLRSFEPRDIAKAAFAWRLLDLSESNGKPIHFAICLDFPAWSLNHPYKITWLTHLPYFVTRRSSAFSPNFAKFAPDESVSVNVHSLLQAEKRGIFESSRIVVGTREVAEEMARSGLQAEFNPFPALADSPAWQTTIARLFKQERGERNEE